MKTHCEHVVARLRAVIDCQRSAAVSHVAYILILLHFHEWTRASCVCGVCVIPGRDGMLIILTML